MSNLWKKLIVMSLDVELNVEFDISKNGYKFMKNGYGLETNMGGWPKILVLVEGRLL